jgi:outer membrane protein TolC
MIALILAAADEPNSAETRPGKAEVGALRAATAEVAKQADPDCQQVWPMTLHNAIAIALEKSEIVRVISLDQNGISHDGCHFDAEPESSPEQSQPASLPDRANVVGPSLVIQRLNEDAARFRFKSEVMAQVRSVEQQYWNLAQAHVALWAAEGAVGLAQDVVSKEQNELLLVHGGDGDLVEATDHLERLKHDLTERTSDVINAERRLRQILGLPESDHTRIIPVTAPTQARIEPDWDTCLDALMDQQPDLVQQKLITRLAELRLLTARHQALPQESFDTIYQMNTLGQALDDAEQTLMSTFLEGLEMEYPAPDWGTQCGRTANVVCCSIWSTSRRWQPSRLKKKRIRSGTVTVEIPDVAPAEVSRTGASTRAPLVNTRQAQYTLIRSRAFLKIVVHQTTHSLARGFLEVDSGFKCYAAAQRSRLEAEKRLEAQRIYWEEGRITADRFLDAVDQYAAGVTTENLCLANYNTAIAFLSECKGTLLADRNIMVVEPSAEGRPD